MASLRASTTMPFAILLVGAVSLLGLKPTQVCADDDPAPPTIAELLQQAADLKAQSQWDQALEALAQVVARAEEDRPSAALAQARRGQYRLEMAMLAEAEEELLKVAQQFPDQSEAINWARLFLIDTYRFQTKPDQAEAAGQALLSDSSALPIQQAWCRVKLGSLFSELQRLDDALAVLEGLDFITLPDGDVGPLVSGQFLRAEILMKRGAAAEAIPLLEQVITMAAGDTHAPTRNWARVRLLESLTHSWSLDHAYEVAQQVVSDHASGQASDQQVAWAFIWQARGLSKAGQFEQAVAPLQMAAAVAEANHPDLVYEAEFALGEVYRQQGDSVVHEDMGPLHEQALAHYQAALVEAQQAGLGEDKQDLARLQVGSEMRHLGMRERGMAWLRMGIADPANLTAGDELLAQRLASFMLSDEQEEWHAYLEDPAGHGDPTAPFVEQEFGTTASPPSTPFVSKQSIRHCWRGKLYLQQERYAEALAKFQEAEAAAATAGQRAEARLGQVRAYRSQAHALRQSGNRDQARLAMMYGYQVAGSAVADWLEVALTGSEGDAHYATEKAVFGYGILQRREEALQTAEEFLTQLTLAQAEPSKVAFAHYMKMQALAWNNRFEEAIDLALQIDSEYAGSARAVVDRIRVAALLRAAGYYARIGQADAGHALLDTIQARHPTGEFDDSVDSFRSVVQRYTAGQGE